MSMNRVVDVTKVAGYCLVELLYGGSKTVIYRTVREKDWQSVAFKLLRPDSPTCNNLSLLRNHDTITKPLEISGVVLHVLHLTPLSVNRIHQLVADTLDSPLHLVKPLAYSIERKTPGNPFFITQVLKVLHQEGFMHFNHQAKHWQFDANPIGPATLTEDVVEFMVRQLQKLPESTQSLLKLAACFGNVFDLNTLSRLAGLSPLDTAVHLWSALQEGFILLNEEETVTLTDVCELGAIDLLPNSTYRFIHDRIQQAAYHLIPQREKAITHLQIGRLLWRETPLENLDEKLFAIVNQFNLGIEGLEDPSESLELANLNLMATRKAKAIGAYATALYYATVGIQLLPIEAWEQEYRLTLMLHTEAAEAAFLCGDFSRMELSIAIGLRRAQTSLDRFAFEDIQVQAYIVQHQPVAAIGLACKTLKSLGISLPDRPTLLDWQQGFAHLNHQLSGLAIASPIDLPPMTQPEALAAMQLMSRILNVTLTVHPTLSPLIIFKQLHLSLQWGNTALSASAYTLYGMLLCGVLEDIEKGYQFGQLGLDVLDRFGNSSLRVKVLAHFHAGVSHWREPLQASLEPLKQGYEMGLEIGDLESAAICGHLYSQSAYFASCELNQLEIEVAAYSRKLRQIQQGKMGDWNEIYHQHILDLLGRSDRSYQFGETIQNVERFSVQDRFTVCVVHILKAIADYLFYRWDEALHSLQTAEPYLSRVLAMEWMPQFNFYQSLTQLKTLPVNAPLKQDTQLEPILINQHQMSIWAHYAPTNYLHKFYLVEAEYYRILSEKDEAIEYYEMAIRAAQANGYVREEALALELAGNFYLQWGKPRLAQEYLIAAYQAYSRWGAKTKTDHLKQCYAQLLAPILEQIPEGSLRETDRDLSRNESSKQSASRRHLANFLTQPACFQR